MRSQAKKEGLLFEKRSKNFCFAVADSPVSDGAKVFWFFFSKKNILPSLSL
jgi:hypothetical protein